MFYKIVDKTTTLYTLVPQHGCLTCDATVRDYYSHPVTKL